MQPQSKTTKKLTPQQIDYIELETQCCLCGTTLQFEHQFDDSALRVQEKAQCPSCNIRLKDKEFLIH